MRTLSTTLLAAVAAVGLLLGCDAPGGGGSGGYIGPGPGKDTLDLSDDGGTSKADTPDAGPGDPDGTKDDAPPITGDCEPGTTRCAGNAIQVCGPGGQIWSEVATCPTGQICAEGACCQTQCATRECGPDGCGGSCGTCEIGLSCVGGQCECAGSCEGRECGDDGCGNSCGSCGLDSTCQDGSCSCTPSCAGKSCGPDGCGGTCGDCMGCDGPDPSLCMAGGKCATPCCPDCTGRECGSDDCGGTCGVCGTGEVCTAGQCVTEGTGDGVLCAACATDDDCKAGLSCLSDGASSRCQQSCSGSGGCPSGWTCLFTMCVPPSGACTGCMIDGCPAGQTCNWSTGACESVDPACSACTDPSPACVEVGGEWYCVECTDDSYCGGGATCDTNTYTCEGGTVTGTCDSDADCDPGQTSFDLHCDMDTGLCYDSTGGCDDTVAFCRFGAECYGFGGLPLPGLPGGCVCDMDACAQGDPTCPCPDSLCSDAITAIFGGPPICGSLPFPP